MELKGKVALITGGGTGLGLEISRLLAQEGMDVAINYSRSQKEAEQAAAELQTLGVKSRAVQADASKEADILRMIAEVSDKFGRIDLLINNAGVTKKVPFPELDGLDEATWDLILNTNVKGPFFAARAVAPVMRRNGGGSIINTASIAGIRALGSSLAYSVSKAANIHLTRGLALALAPDIRVNAVAPGLLLTRWFDDTSPETVKKMEQHAPLKQAVDLKECAQVYIMLAKNGSMTGETITVDAGTSQV